MSIVDAAWIVIPRLRKTRAELLADVGILERHDAVGELDERDLGPEVAIHAGPLDADGAGADDRDPPGHVAARERLVAR